MIIFPCIINNSLILYDLATYVKAVVFALVPIHPLAEETTESKGGHFAKLKWFSIAKITILWKVLKFKRGHGPLAPLFPPPMHPPSVFLVVSGQVNLEYGFLSQLQCCHCYTKQLSTTKTQYKLCSLYSS